MNHLSHSGNVSVHYNTRVRSTSESVVDDTEIPGPVDVVYNEVSNFLFLLTDKAKAK